MVGVRSSALSSGNGDDGLMDHSASANCDSHGCQRLCLREVVAAPRGWGLAHSASEHLREMRLVCETAGIRDLAERLGRRQHQILRHLQSQTNDVRVGGLSDRLFERVVEMPPTRGKLFPQVLRFQRALTVSSY